MKATHTRADDVILPEQRLPISAGIVGRCNQECWTAADGYDLPLVIRPQDFCAELGVGAFVTAAVNHINIEQKLNPDGFTEGVIAVCGAGVIGSGENDVDPKFLPYVPRKTPSLTTAVAPEMTPGAAQRDQRPVTGAALLQLRRGWPADPPRTR